MWSSLLAKLLLYLPSSDSCMDKIEDENDQETSEISYLFGISIFLRAIFYSYTTYFLWHCCPGINDDAEVSNGIASESQRVEASPKSPESTTVPSISNHLFAEKLVPVLVDLLLQAPPAEKYKILPDIIQSLGRWELIMHDRSSSFFSRLSLKIDHTDRSSCFFSRHHWQLL